MVLKLENMKEGNFYLVKLKSHRMYAPPRLTKKQVLEKIKERGWNNKEVEIEEANFPYAYLYEKIKR